MLSTKTNVHGAQTTTVARPTKLALRLIGASALVASMAAMPGIAAAQAAAPARGPTVLEEITVTARKVEENLQSVPVAVTAYTGEQLVKQGAVKVGDIANFTPGLITREAASNPTAMSISIRGQVQGDVLATLDPSVGTYVDGYYWARAYGGNADLVDVQSVQVLKGPQGTLFGRNTTGGAVLIQTNDPILGEFSGTVRATVGNYNLQTGLLVANLPIGEKAALRVAMQSNKRDGMIDDFRNGKTYDNIDNISGRVKLLVEPAEGLRFVLSGEWFEYDTNGPSRYTAFFRNPVVATPTQPAFASLARTYATLFGIPGMTVDGYIAQAKADPDGTALDGDPFTTTKTATYTGTMTMDTSVGLIKLITGYRKVKSQNRLDLDGSPYAVHTTTLDQSLDQFSTELQITGATLNGALDYAAGVAYFSEGGTDRSQTIAVPLLNPTTNVFLGDIDSKSWGVYAQGTYHVTDRFRVTGGLRYSADDKGITIGNKNVVRASGFSICSYPGAVAPDCVTERSDSFDATSYTIGVDYEINPDVLVYAKTGKGYRSGGQNLRAVNALTFVPFGPETVKEHELGLKSEFFERRVRLNLAAYYNTIEGAQRSTLKGTIVNGQATSYTLLENAAKVRNYGLEAEFTAALTDNFQVSATGLLNKSKYLEFSELPSPTNPTGDRTNERLGATPEKAFSVAAQYNRDLSFGEFGLRVDYYWVGETPISSGDNPLDPNQAALIAATTQPAGGVLGARASLGFGDGKYEIAVWGRNLGDNRDQISALFVDPFGYVSNQRRTPTTYGLTATAKF